ncbi:hypothetical protein Agabi119p4_117 [Agaricus bisporus var. burnettii]|uniref:Uncharacterized protein n=1 Tax=Agaricus bisporus var. burnettii TaxID=192524 RepID=A0A8H7FA12_AGABI|nr:hypothetical protein AGABI2DRAFT_189268 [Agaricus bisporus var. bisporus H97]EKV50957.1 hypothetical protein AGABI2DRAFT_189268 [Agaricus bisporus var. bisporus H97]KAF7783952.1 hypothetical protein Agabi119p4_117 [Agaricus bisporus var. burnettii]
MKPAQTVKQFVLKAVGKNKDKKQPVKDDRASFDQDCETLVNVPVSLTVASSQERVDISFLEDLVWGPAPAPDRERNRNASR